MQRNSAGQAASYVLGLFSAGLAAGGWVGSVAVARAVDPYDEVELLAHVLGTIQRDFVDPVPPGALVDAAVDGMMAALDPHSRWLSADDYAAFDLETAGTDLGIGVAVVARDGGVTIGDVVGGSPAGRDGLAPGDTLVAIDGEPVTGLTPSEIEDRLRGARGAPVTLSVVRHGAPLEVHTVRDTVHVPATTVELLPDGVAYLRLTQFQRGAAFEVTDAMRGLDQRGMTALVLDLRDNPGGLLEEAVGVADLFLEQGPIVTTRGRVDGEQVHYATPGGYAGLPVVVLVNGRSASAAEVVAGALQDTRRAQLVGARTWGKGSVQTVYENEDGSAMKLTIGRYYTPSGEPVADRDGREPDVPVAMPARPTAASALRARIGALPITEPERAEMLALLAAIEPGSASEAPVPWTVAASERGDTDPQLARAIEMVSAAR
jgi:carboxyl-terminal processing protease